MLTALLPLLASPPALASDDLDAEPKHHIELGLTVGTPGGFNGIVGYFYDRVGARFTFGYTPDLGTGMVAGVQGLFGYEFDPGSRHNHVVGVHAGVMTGTFDYIWGGVGYSIRLQRGFYFESGWGFGVGDGGPVQLLFQIGYLGRINL